MNLYCRLIWLLLRLPWLAKQRDVLAPSHLNMRVMLNDLDLNWHVNNGRYLTMMDLGRFHLLGVTGLLKIMLRYRWMPVIGSAKIHFIRPLRFFEEFTMKTQVIYWDEKWFYIRQELFKKEVLCVSALFKGLFMGKKGKITPEELLAHLNIPLVKPPLAVDLAAWLEAEKKS